jgi:hypothetical protein
MNSPFRLTALLALSALSTAAPANYQSLFLQDFEGSEWPAKLTHGHNSSPYTTQVIAFGTKDPVSILGNGADAYVGRQALRFQPLQDDPHLSVINQSILSRQRLGADGAAMYQVDFFLDEETGTNPRVALLAQASDPVASGNSKSYRFYRFGLDEKGRVYFSFTNETPTPVIFTHDSIATYDLKRPGWHRFQMIFKGQDEIYCAIDGQTTSYSPIRESTLNYLAAGIMVTRTPGGDDPTIYADNLSIHWTNDKNAPLLGSPWSGGSSPETGKVQWNTPTLTWLTSASDAWKEAQKTKRVMFVLFHDDNALRNESLAKLLSTPEAEQVLSRCTLLRINMSEPAGMKIAESYNITVAPVLMVAGSDGRPMTQTSVAMEANPTWDQVYAQLRTQRSGAAAQGAGVSAPTQ